MKKKSFAIFLLPLLLAGCFSEESKFFDLCEEAIKQSLRSPSGYKRISKIVEKKTLSVEDYLKKAYTDEGKSIEKELTSSQRALFDSGAHHPVEFKAIVQYDAPNAFGTLIRGGAVCTHLSANGTTKYLSSSSIKINGKSSYDRISDFSNSVSGRK